MTFQVTHGFDDVMAPEKSHTGEAPSAKERPCGAQHDIDLAMVTLRLVCTKRLNHDDPMAEVGGGRTDPNHGRAEEIDGVLVTYSWRSDR